MDPAPQSLERTTKRYVLEPAVLFLSGQSVLAGAAPEPSTLLYNVTSDIRAIPNKDSSVAFERVEGNVSIPELSSDMPQMRHRRLFSLVHPAHAQYRTDIPAQYYITSATPEVVGNIRLESLETRFQRPSFKAMLSAGRTASDKPLFDKVTVLFETHPIANWKLGRHLGSSYRWNDSNGGQVAVEGIEDGTCRLSVTRRMPRELRDALVASWLLRLWYETAESKQAKRECELPPKLISVAIESSNFSLVFESMTSPEAYREAMNPYMERQCIIM